MRRTTPRIVNCEMCETPFESYALHSMARFCPACRKIRHRERNRKYAETFFADPENRKKRYDYFKQYKKRNAEQTKQWNRKYYEKRKQDPEFLEKNRQRVREYYRNNVEKIRAAERDKHQLKKAMERDDASLAFRMMDKIGTLKECPRMLLKAATLPCGKHEICFGDVRCTKCPPWAKPPAYDKRKWHMPWNI